MHYYAVCRYEKKQSKFLKRVKSQMSDQLCLLAFSFCQMQCTLKRHRKADISSSDQTLNSRRSVG